MLLRAHLNRMRFKGCSLFQSTGSLSGPLHLSLLLSGTWSLACQTEEANIKDCWNEGVFWKSSLHKCNHLTSGCLLDSVSHPRCWQWRSPAQGQCLLGPSFCTSQESSSIRWLEESKQRSRSMGLAKQTGKSRAECIKETETRVFWRCSEKNQREADEWMNEAVVFYLCGKHSRALGCSQSGIDMCCLLFPLLHFGCTDPTCTADPHSTPHLYCRTETKKHSFLFFKPLSGVFLCK